MKKTLIITTLLAVLMCGCGDVHRSEYAIKADKAYREQSAASIVQQIEYVRDDRTGICYAVVAGCPHCNNRSITEVSCNKAFQDPNDPICGDPVEFKKHFPANAAPATNANTHRH